MAEFGPLQGFGDQLAALETTLGANEALAQAFNDQLKDMQITFMDLSDDVGALSKGISSGLRKAFDGLIFDGMKLSDALKTVAGSMVNAAYNSAITPVTNHFGGLLGQAVGGLVNSVLPFQAGGALSLSAQNAGAAAAGRPAGAGVPKVSPAAQAPQNVQVTMNITTPDAPSFQRSQAQIAAQMSRALSRGQRLR